MDDEQFRYDAAANRLDLNTRRFDKVRDNRLKKLNGHEFDYDPWGNLVTKRSGPWQTDLQEFRYDSENRLVHTRRWEAGRLVSEGRYQYDSLGRRIKKTAVTAEDTTPQKKTFQWQGLRLLREHVLQGQRL